MLDHSSLYRAQLFGPFTVLREGQPLGAAGAAPGLTAARKLIKWFLLHPSVQFTTEELAAVLPPGRSCPRNRLNRTLHYLRDYLEPDRGGRASDFIHRSDLGYHFDPGGRWSVDQWDAATIVATAREACRRGDLQRAISELEVLSGLEDMMFLPEEIYDDAFSESRTTQASACREARLLLLELYLEDSRLPQVLSSGLTMLDQDPYDEVAVRAVAAAQSMGGDRIAGLQSVLEFRARMAEELGIAPGDDVLDLEAQLRSGADLTSFRKSRRLSG